MCVYNKRPKPAINSWFVQHKQEVVRVCVRSKTGYLTINATLCVSVCACRKNGPTLQLVRDLCNICGYDLNPDDKKNNTMVRAWMSECISEWVSER